jgi:hypothetical protein
MEIKIKMKIEVKNFGKFFPQKIGAISNIEGVLFILILEKVSSVFLTVKLFSLH